jgi:hypothetical protein
MPKIKNKYTGSVLEVTTQQLETLKATNFPFELIEGEKPKKPDVLLEAEKKIEKFFDKKDKE